jgi:hypothetical protein
MIGLLLPVWADDTVAIIWWGLAGLALASHQIKGDKVIQKDSEDDYDRK